MKSLKISLLCIALLVAVIYTTSALIPKSPYLIGIAILESGAVIYAFFRWFSRQTVYQCNYCGLYFALSPISNLMAINALDTRFVRCPACDKSGFDECLSRIKINSERPEAEIIEPGKVATKNENWRGFYIQMTVVSLIYIVCVVVLLLLRHKVDGLLNLSYEGILGTQKGLSTALVAISALYTLYLAVFVSAIRHRYKTGLYTVMTVILSLLFFIILLIKYSRIRELGEIAKAGFGWY